MSDIEEEKEPPIQKKKWIKLWTDSFKEAPTNTMQNIVAWATIITGVASLLIGVTALHVSYKQLGDERQLDTLGMVVQQLRDEIKATNTVSDLTRDQNTKIDSQSKILTDESKQLISQVNLTSKIFQQSETEFFKQHELDTLFARQVLFDIFDNMTYACEKLEGNLSEERLTPYDTSTLNEFLLNEELILQKLKENRRNPIIIYDGKTRIAWDDYLQKLDEFNSYRFADFIADKNSFIKANKIHRRASYFTFKQPSLEFFNQFIGLAKGYPGNKYLKELLLKKTQ